MAVLVTEMLGACSSEEWEERNTSGSTGVASGLALVVGVAMGTVSAARASSVCQREVISSRHLSLLRKDVKKCLVPLFCMRFDSHVALRYVERRTSCGKWMQCHLEYGWSGHAQKTKLAHLYDLYRIWKEQIAFWQDALNVSCVDLDRSREYSRVEAHMPKHHIDVALAQDLA